jgi:hypothetical protein
MNLALPGVMNDLQLPQPAKAQLQHSALSTELLPEAEPKKPLEPQDDYDKYDVSRLACTE